MKSYTITPSGSGKIATSLCKRCGPGQIGEPLVLNGCSQAAFALFVAKLAHEQIVEKKRSVAQLAEVFDMISACNASAAKQALADCMIEADEETAAAIFGKGKEREKPTEEGKPGKLKAFTVATYWKHIGGGKSAPNTSLLD